MGECSAYRGPGGDGKEILEVGGAKSGWSRCAERGKRVDEGADKFLGEVSGIERRRRRLRSWLPRRVGTRWMELGKRGVVFGGTEWGRRRSYEAGCAGYGAFSDGLQDQLTLDVLWGWAARML